MKKLKIILFALAIVMTMFSMTACSNYVCSDNDFTIGLTVDSTSIYQGEMIEVTVVFKNVSGRRHRVTHPTTLLVVFIDVDIENWNHSYPFPGEFRLLGAVDTVFSRNHTITQIVLFGADLPVGEHPLTASAMFTIGGQRIRIVTDITYVAVY